MTNLDKIAAEVETTSQEAAAAWRRVSEYRNGESEGGYGYNPHYAAACAASKRAADAAEKMFRAEWTKEVTQERREAWNSRARNMAPTISNREKLEAELGFTADELRRAIEIHF